VSTPVELLLDGFGRLPEHVSGAVDALTPEQLTRRLDRSANSICWLVWHLARVEDASFADAFGTEPVWTEADWHDRFGLPLARDDMGFGHDDEQVAAVRVESPDLLVGYYADVHARTTELLQFVTSEELDRVVDRSYDPPVTLAVRLMSVLEDAQQHVGQALFARGIVERAG
jgi:hypothetical protein